MSTEIHLNEHRGACLCGAVTFIVRGELPAPDACHCEDCRRFSGHFFSSTDVRRSALTIEGADLLSWYQTSPKVRRGFCSRCGSSLFWDPLGHDWTAIAMGAFDSPTGTQLGKHIWVADKGDYYAIGDGLPQNAH